MEEVQAAHKYMSVHKAAKSIRNIYYERKGKWIKLRNIPLFPEVTDHNGMQMVFED